jgi:hypothetical protein
MKGCQGRNISLRQQLRDIVLNQKVMPAILTGHRLAKMYSIGVSTLPF